MYKKIDFTGVPANDLFGHAETVFSAADSNGDCVCGSPLPMKNGCEPGMAACDRPITKAWPVALPSKPLPTMRRIFGNRLLWRRQSQIGWKWIRATPL
jgi:hypothetical protein